jgi:hypothetical protein
VRMNLTGIWIVLLLSLALLIFASLVVGTR